MNVVRHPEIARIQAEVSESGNGQDSTAQVLPVGNESKSGLTAVSDSECVTKIETRELAGIVSYDASEFLITAQAGTRVSDINDALQEKGQYLPFDPLLVDQDATLGGTVASGLSGPNRLLYGSIRDFVMEVEFVDGLGRLIRGGGKVVKNAAGFDLPKLMCGSYGRLGVLTEVTLKILPKPTGTAGLTASSNSMANCIQAIQQLRNLPLPISALEIFPEGNGAFDLDVALMGPAESLAPVVERANAVMNQSLENVNANLVARDSLFSLSAGELLLRAATDAEQLLQLTSQLESSEIELSYQISCGGAVTWLKLASASDTEELDRLLTSLSISAVTIAGAPKNVSFLGNTTWISMANRIKKAIDPHDRFLAYRAHSAGKLLET